MPLFTEGDYWELLTLGVDASIALLIYYYYKGTVKDAEAVESTMSYTAGSEELITAVQDAKVLPYACVEGYVEASATPLRSNFSDVTGVVRRQTFVEHKIERTQGFWREVRRIIKDSTNSIPFRIVGPKKAESSDANGVDVTELLSAEYVHDSLATTHDIYHPSQDGVVSRSFDRLFGELTKGYQESEHMLGVGVPIIGIGQIASTSGGRFLRLGPPREGLKYIVTTMSKSEVIQVLKKDARVLKIFVWVFGLVGAGILAHLLYKHTGRVYHWVKFKRMLANVRAQRQDNVAQDEDMPEGQTNDWTCVVCLTNRREVIALDCGHIALCGQCTEALPMPHLCPVCRAPVRAFQPVYVA